MLSSSSRIAVVAITSSLTLGVAASSAQAQTNTEAFCRASIAKETAKYVKTLFKLTFKCHAKRSAGKIDPAINCNDVVQADASGKKVTKGRAKLRAVVGGSKDACTDQDAVLAQYARCPSPVQSVDDAGATTGIDTFAELADCLVAQSEALAGQASLKAMGSPEPPIGRSLAKCQKEIGKRLGKLVQTIMKERSRCQAGLDNQQQGLSYGCVGEDPKLKIARAIEKLDSGIAKRCAISDPQPLSTGNETLDLLGACGDTVGQLQTCVGDITGLRFGSGLAAMAYELPGECRAGSVLRTVNASAGNQLGQTFLDTGFSGTAHGLDVPDFSTDALFTDCDSDCANCDVTLDVLKEDPLSYCRCVNNTRQSCDVINGVDTDDCGPNGQCLCHFGPPLPISSGGVPVCVINEILQDYEGTIDVGAGRNGEDIRLAAVVYLGIEVTKPCPTCEGDITARDNVADGACEGGLLNGAACDVSGIHPSFGNMSFDCPPNSLLNISGTGLLINLNASNDPQSLPFNLPCDDAGQMCPCRVCSANANLGCASDQECADAGAGACTAGGGAGVHQNNCTDGVCTADQECNTGPDDTFCDGAVTPKGEGYVSCTTTPECSTSGLGTCSLTKRRRCYVDPIVVTGEAGTYRGASGSLFCIPPTTSAAVNSSGGLPGAGRLSLEYENQPRCASDPGEIWEAPGGSNCAPVTTTTTTTLFPPVLCEISAAPACGGTCDPGQVCEPVPPANVTCECNPVVTTTTLPASCGDVFPLCGTGGCPMGETCQLNGTLDACVCVPGTACGDTTFPICGGTCGPGQSCQGDTIGQPCSCTP